MNDKKNDELAPTGAGGSAGHTGIPVEIAVLLIYLFGWLGGLVFILVEKENTFVRFHAMQSIVLSIAATGVFIALGILSVVPVLGFVSAYVMTPLLGLGLLGLTLYLIVKTMNGEDVRLPVISEFADRWLASL